MSSPDLSSPTARRRLKPLPKSGIYWQSVGEGQHFGYRKVRAGAGTWWARLYLGRGAYTSHGFLGAADDLGAGDGASTLSYREALEAATDWWRDERRKRAIPAGGASRVYLVADAMADYLAWYREHRRGLARTEQIIRGDILPVLGKLQLAGPPTDTGAPLTRTDVRLWHQRLASRPARLRNRAGAEPNYRPLETEEDKRRRRSSANRALVVLRAALNFAVAEGIIVKAAADAWRVSPFKQADAPKVRYLELGEAQRLVRVLEDVDQDFARLVEAALHTGCDYGELAALTVSDYRAGADAVSVGLGKVESRRRTVFLGEDGVAFFDGVTAGRSPRDRMFLRRGRPWGRSEQTRPLRQGCERAGISPPIGFKILRHTFASLYLQAGGDLPALSKQLGHTDTRMTLRHYAHLAGGWRAEDAAKHAPKLGLGKARTVERLRPGRPRSTSR